MLKDQLLQILEKSRAAELEFFASLTDEDKAGQGTYEKWSVKDVVAHANYWEDVRSTRNLKWIQGDKLEPMARYEQANVECFERFVNRTWDEVEAFAEQAHANTVKTVKAIDEDAFNGPSEESEDRKVWESIVGTAYTHKHIHYSEIYLDRGRKKEVSQLWSEWADLVSPMDAGSVWQSRVHYNAACGLALAGDQGGAFDALKKSLELDPSMKAWSRRDSDLEILHGLPEYRELFAPAYWWEALEADPQKEAIADQFIRTLAMLREAVHAFSEEAWLEGESLYQRPAGLALHVVQSVDSYSTSKPGERLEDELTQVNWQERDASKFPAQEELIRYLDKVEQRLANFIKEADLGASEDMFPWTGFTVLSRMLYSLRHAQHHLADMAMELQRRGSRPPVWQ